MIDKDIDLIRNHFKNYPILKAYLFGSKARGEATKQSDIDLLVKLDEGVSLFDFIRIKNDLEDLLKKTVDLVSEEGLSPYILPDINNDKILIYEQKKLR
jgi:uncharacterized protein